MTDAAYLSYSDAGRQRLRYALASSGVIALFVLVGHLASIDTGLYLDDHAHYEHLRHYDWSFQSAVKSSRLGIVGDVMDLWGRHEAGLLFFRPIAFWIMKIEYTLVGFQPLGMHLFCLGWHFVCCLLTAALAMRFLGSRFWATVAGSLMAIHPGHMATVYWIACQTELLGTALVLTSVLAYAHYARWPIPVLSSPGTPASALQPQAGASALFGLLVVAAYALALGCRENCILLPLVCWAGDWLCRSPGRRVLRPIIILMLLVTAGYFALRWQALGGFPLPAKPYLMPISDPQFPIYCLEKAAIYLIGLGLFIPIVPIGGNMFFASRWGLLAGGVAIVVLLLAVVWWRHRRTTGGVGWLLLWMACFFAPVMPVFASSHHLYLPGVGMTLLMAAGLRLCALRGDGRASSPARLWTAGTGMGVLAIGLSALTWAMGFTFSRGTLVEDVFIDNVVQRGKPIREGDHLFFINMPVLAYYAAPAIRCQLGLRELHGHVLTFAPDLLGMQRSSTLEIPDEHTLRLTAGAEDRYLEGITGQILRGMMSLEHQARAGEAIDAGAFTVTPLEVDERGIRQLSFRFTEPLAQDGYHFYFGSPQFMAYPVEVGRLR